MKVKGVSFPTVQAIGEELNILVTQDRPRNGFLLRPKGDHYRRLRPDGKRINAVCQHGYRRFFADLFAFAEAHDLKLSVRSTWGEYASLQDMLQTVARTPYGPYMQYDYCTCGED